MAELKTQANNASVEEFINKVEHKTRHQDALVLLDLFKEITKETPMMWGDSIIGFGSYHYKSERSSQEGDWPLTGFSPRKQNLSLYIMPGFNDIEYLTSKLGKHKTSVSCLYINKLSDVDLEILKKIIDYGYQSIKEQNP